MPFDPVDGKDFSEVALGVEHYLHVAQIEGLLDKLPPFQGWKASQYFSAAMQMAGQGADDLYASDKKHGEQIAAMQTQIDQLQADQAGLRLENGRQQEQINTMMTAISKGSSK
jgi:hypothetical protein